MDPSQTYSREYSQKVIDDEITSLEEPIRALRHRRNALTPISSLPTEVIAAIFSFVRFSSTSLVPHKLAWLRVAHVCHQWREIALNEPFLWSHLDLIEVSPAGAAEILARAKKVPLHLKASVPDRYRWPDPRVGAIQNELQAHVSHICHLSISAEEYHLRETLERLVSPAPILEHLSLSCKDYDGRVSSVPDNIFDCTTPRLSCLVLIQCHISWKSPLLRGLTHLEIRGLFMSGRPSLPVWLDMLDETPQLKTLILDKATPVVPPGASHLSGIERTITLPFLVHLDISASARDCGLALAHLNLPALTLLHVKASSSSGNGDDAREIIPYVSRHAHGPQDARPLQSMLISGGEGAPPRILAWTKSDIDVNLVNLDNVATRSARVTFIVTIRFRRIGAWFFDEAMAALPLENLVTLAAGEHTWLADKGVWLRHASRWPLLRHVHLVTSAARGFREMLLEDIGGSGRPLLPSLTNLSLEYHFKLSARRTLRLCDALMWRVEQGVPLETLDLRTCLVTSSRAVQLLSEIVVDIWGPEGFYKGGPSSSTWDSGARGYFIRDSNSEY